MGREARDPMFESQNATQDLRGHRYGVIGGGLSGLAAAWYLQRRGAETHIFERENTLGGRAISGLLGDRQVTLGGKNIGREYARFRAFTASLGDHPYEYFGINSSRVLDGKLFTLDSEHRLKALLNLRGISPRDLSRLGRLVLGVKRSPQARYLNPDDCRRLARRYRGKTLQDAFGSRIVELLLRSLTVRVSAAEPDEVPMANVLPYVGMITDTYDQLAKGMHEVLSAAGARSRVHLGAEVRRLVREQGRICGLRLAEPTHSGELEMAFDGVVLATPAHGAARLLADLAPPAASLLREVRYFPVTVLLAEYERPVFQSNVRATVFSAESPLSNAGAYGPEDLNVIRYTFSGRAARGLAEHEPDPQRLVAMAEAALSPFADMSGNRRRALLARSFSPGLCAYHPDQAGFLDGFGSMLEGLRGLTVTGDYLCGCSIEACFAAAERAVQTVVPMRMPRQAMLEEGVRR